MLTPAIRAILYPPFRSTGRQPPHLVAKKSRAPKRKTDARTNAPPGTGGSGCARDRIRASESQGRADFESSRMFAMTRRFLREPGEPKANPPVLSLKILLFKRCIVMVGAMREQRIHQVFVVSVAAKGLHALIEIAGGLALYITSTATIIGWINRLSQGELTE